MGKAHDREVFYPMGKKLDVDWEGKNFSFFQNTNCEYFPCHPTIHAGDFNCLFCYCPLYALGDACGGNFDYLPSGIKDCSHCVLPHIKNNFGMILEKFDRVAALAARPSKNQGK